MLVWMILAAIVLILAFGFFIGGAIVQYIVEYWVSHLSGKDTDVSYWLCCIAGVFVGWNIGIPALIVTWIFDLAT